MEKFVKVGRLILFLGLLGFLGCTTVQIPEYIQDKNPYKREFAASFDETLSATKGALKDLGWRILQTYDPVVFEQTPHPSAGGGQLLIFTESKQSSRILYSRYTRLNLYLRSLKDDRTEVEIRYAATTSVLIKNFKSYKNNRSVHRVFDQIAAHLKK